MHISGKLQIFGAALVLLLAQAHCDQQFMCYVCENCAQITESTPKKICDETFFDNSATTVPPATTIDSTVTPTTTSSSSASTETSGSTEETTLTTTTASSTSPPMPTASTVGPPLSTTSLPTPPTPGTVAGPIDVEALESNNTTTTPIPSTFAAPTTISTSATDSETTFLKPVNIVMQPAQLRVRQLRSVADNAMFTYHCYWVQQNVNGSQTTSRGCTRINQTEAVCPQLEMTSKTKFEKCTPCTNSLCNSSGVVGVSAVAVILGLVCAFLSGFPA